LTGCGTNATLAGPALDTVTSLDSPDFRNFVVGDIAATPRL
jgi:hypothetical protein